ncbi:MAG: amidohydrolase family protein [Rhodobacteraceae bacterium]|nr:amidohydrolase family protein [Paracoccaceae bacterium]
MSIKFLAAAAALIWTSISISVHADVLIENVTLIDGTGVPARANTNVLVTGDTITEISTSPIAIPAGAARVDGTGKYLIPGLINSHIHLPGGRTGPGNRTLISDTALGERVLHGFLYAGVTAIYDSGNNIDYVFKMRDDERAGRIVAARVFSTGRLVTRAGGYQCCAGGLQVEGIEDGLRKLDDVIARKPDMLKFIRERRGMGVNSANLPMVPLDVMTALIARAHEAGIRTTVHVSEEQLARESVEAGIDALAHPVYLAESSEEFAKFLAAKGIIVSTTMGRVDADATVFDEPIFAATMSPEERKSNQANPGYFNTPRGTWRSGLMKAVMHNILQMHQAGVVLAAGTDRSMGAYLHRELFLLVQSGLTPLEAITAGTLNSAKYIGVDDRLGTIEKGKLADLVLLARDPLSDIANTAAIVSVYKGGMEIDRSALKLPVNGFVAPPGADSGE